jgi:hypothetical protein
MRFESGAYGDAVAKILALDGAGERIMPVAHPKCASAEARDAISRAGAQVLFPHARAPEAAQAGLFLYFSCYDEAHEVAQNIGTAEGSYWHAIVHRQEPDAGNSSYWFRRVGKHTIFPELRAEASRILAASAAAGMRLPEPWDPFWFIDVCERAAREAAPALLQPALEIQRVEWQLLFHYCASAA